MQLRRSVLLSLLIIAFIIFETHSCSEDRSVEPFPPLEIKSELLGANDLYFADADHGWVVGRMGTAILTDDGGDTWTPVTIDELDMRGVYFSDTQNGWVVAITALDPMRVHAASFNGIPATSRMPTTAFVGPSFIKQRLLLPTGLALFGMVGWRIYAC